MTPGPRPPRRWQGIGARVMILAATGMLTSLALFGVIGWELVRHLRADLARYRAATVAGLAAHVDDRLTAVFSALQGVANATRGLLDEPGSPVVAADLRDAYLRAGYVDAVFLANRRGALLASEPLAWPGCPLPDLAALITARPDAGVPFASNLVPCRADGEGRWRILLLVPVRDWQGTLRAFAGAALDPSGRRFGSFAPEAFLAATGDVRLLDAADRVIASTPPLEPGVVSTDTPAVSRRLAVAPWRVAGHDEAGHASGTRMAATLGVAVPLLLGLAVLFAWGAGRSVSRPLHVLTAAAERIEGGDLQAPIPPLGSDEVGRLGHAFERMRQELARSLDAIATANAELERRVADRTAQLARANAELEARERIRHELLRKVISAQEDERKRLARELHDETTQTLTALGMRLELAAAAPPGDRERELEEARVLATRSLDELRRLMHDLRPSVLDDLGLVPAIRWYADRHLVSRGVAVRFEVGSLPERLPYELETALFRATQEALNNVARHAGAEMVLVGLDGDHGQLAIDIEDDGAGFEPARVQPEPGDLRGLGLLGMRERLELFGGTVQIHSAPGRGTHVAIRVPLPDGAAA